MSGQTRVETVSRTTARELGWMSRPIAFQASGSQPIGARVLIGQSLLPSRRQQALASATPTAVLPNYSLCLGRNMIANCLETEEGRGQVDERARLEQARHTALGHCQGREANTRPRTKGASQPRKLMTTPAYPSLARLLIPGSTLGSPPSNHTPCPQPPARLSDLLRPAI